MNIHYQKPPIIEAIMDFVVTPMVPLEPDQLMAFAQTQSKDYADQSPVSEFTLNIDGQNLGTPTTPSMKVVSYIARDHDENRAFQVRSTGFSYSKLAPYDCWESFFNEGKRIWNLYSNFSNPKSIDRVAVRFINRLDIPLPITDFKDWLQTVPEIAPGLQQSLTSMMLQFQSPQEDLKALLNLTEAIVPPLSTDKCSIVLDIDLFRIQDVPQTESEIDALFLQFKARKNEIFECSITDKTRGLFQ